MRQVVIVWQPTRRLAIRKFTAFYRIRQSAVRSSVEAKQLFTVFDLRADSTVGALQAKSTVAKFPQRVVIACLELIVAY